ncbi:MAG: hypothetical protein CSB33_05230 [Desulfobacterales bacterium]|nr:MAG: hypothetical protein CSB33_05230 [Desulfobacterales bacterium]
MKRLLLLFLLMSVCIFAGCGDDDDNEPVEINAVIVGDRVLDISASLGVLPKVASVRASQWAKASEFPIDIPGCPNYMVNRNPNAINEKIDEYGLDQVIIEDSPEFCLLKPKVNPIDIVDLITNLDVTINVIDFSEGVDSAIRQIAALYGKESEGEELIEKYHEDLEEAEALVDQVIPGKKVVVLSAMKNRETGEIKLYLESKGFYTDKFFLEPFGCENVGDALNDSKTAMISKGLLPVTDLSLLADANPDVIILFENSDLVLEELNALIAENSAVADVPAIQNDHIATSLPYYVGSEVEGYPEILSAWANYFISLE